MFDLQQFIAECQAALGSPQPAQRIEALVKAAIAEPEAIKAAFAKAEGAESFGGVVTFACRNASLSVIDITTPPGLRSAAHNHKMLAVIGVYQGQEHNRFYRDENGTLQEHSERLLAEGDVAVLGPEAIHAVANPLATESRALHIYGGDLLEREGRSMWNPHTSAREVYEVKQLTKYADEISDPR